MSVVVGGGLVGWEMKEFVEYVDEGGGLSRSGLWCGFFVLVGSEGSEVTMGILWMRGIVIELKKRGLTAES